MSDMIVRDSEGDRRNHIQWDKHEKKHKTLQWNMQTWGAVLITLVLFCGQITGFGPLQVWAVEPVFVTESEQATPVSTSTESVQEALKLVIDNQNRYTGMDKTYSDGYTPTVANGAVQVVLPLLCKNGSLKNEELSVSVNLGDSSTMPFVNRNYNKTVRQQTVTTLDGITIDGVYLVEAVFDLKSNRINGSYPVVFTVAGVDEAGTSVEQSFAIYVNISDGVNPDAEPTTEAVTEEPVTYAPKVLVEDCKVSEEQVYAGDDIEVTVTLRNTSKTETIQNMTITASAAGEYFTIQSASDSIYIGSIPAERTTDVVLKYQVNPETPQGQYDLTLSMDYADSKGNTYSGNGNAKLNILQSLHVEFDKLQIVSEAKVADTIDATIQVMNLGRCRIYNVRAVLECDGLKPSGTIFIGDMESGTTENASTTVVVTSLTEGNSLYGATTGTITYFYEDEAGNEYTQTEEVSFTVKTPFSETQIEDTEEPGQWWVIMAVIGILLLLIGGYCLVQWVLRRKERKQMDEELMQSSEATKAE